MDNGLKHRLTGAILLVLLAVLLLPELFTGAGDSPRAAPPTAGSAEVPVRRYDIDLTERALAPAAPADPAPIESIEPTPVEPAPTMTPAPAPAPAPATSPKAAAASSAPAVSTPAASAMAPPGDASGYFVQVGVFSSRAGADRIAKTLRGKGFSVAVSRYDSGKRLYRVRVGPAPDRQAAVALRERLRTAGHAGTLVAPT